MRMKRCRKCHRLFPDTEPGAYCSECSSKQKKDYQKSYNRVEENKERNAPLRSARWAKLRADIIARDKVCMRCLIKFGIINVKDLTVDHIKSRNHYPELMWDESNLICLCRSCNSEKGDNDFLDFPWEPPKKDNNKTYFV